MDSHWSPLWNLGVRQPKSSRTKKSCKSSYTILERPPNERYGERVKVEIIFFYPKQNPSLDENRQQKGGNQP
jgi:hypothetical protein